MSSALRSVLRDGPTRAEWLVLLMALGTVAPASLLFVWLNVHHDSALELTSLLGVRVDIHCWGSDGMLSHIDEAVWGTAWVSGLAGMLGCVAAPFAWRRSRGRGQRALLNIATFTNVTWFAIGGLLWYAARR